MTSVQQLLDRLGQPPREICLDWAWCLISDSCRTGERTPSAWSHWTVDDSGKLLRVVDSPEGDSPVADSSPENTHQLVAQLLEWAGARWRTEADRLDPDVQRRVLAQLTASLGHPTSDVSQTPRQSAELSGQLPSPSQVEPVEFSGEPVGPTAEATCSEAARTASASSAEVRLDLRSGKSLSPSAADELRRSRPARGSSLPGWLAAGVSVSAVGLAMLLWWGSGGRRDTNSTADAKAPSTVDGPQFHAAADDQTSPPIESGDRLMQLSDLGLSPAGMESDQVAVVPFDQAVASAAATLAATSDVGLVDAIPNTAASDNPPADDGVTIASSSVDQASPSGEWESALREATITEPKFNSIAADFDGQTSLVIDAQPLAIAPMLQVMQMPPRLRPREPVWWLRIDVPETFALQPVEPQRLSGRAIAAWKLERTRDGGQAVDEAATVLIQAQLAGRKPDIRWKIALLWDDVPGLALPLEVEKLTDLAVSLAEADKSIALLIETIRTGAAQPVLPREMRTAMAHRRRVLEEELKSIARLRQLVSEALALVGQLETQLTVHGKLIDQAEANPAPTMMHMGQLDLR